MSKSTTLNGKTYQQDSNGDWYEVSTGEAPTIKVINGTTYEKDANGDWYETDVKKKVSSNDIPKPVAGSLQNVSPLSKPLGSATPSTSNNFPLIYQNENAYQVAKNTTGIAPENVDPKIEAERAEQQRQKQIFENTQIDKDPIGNQLRPVIQRKKEIQDLRKGQDNTKINTNTFAINDELHHLDNQAATIQSQRFPHTNDAKNVLRDATKETPLASQDLDNWDINEIQRNIPKDNVTYQTALKQYADTRKVNDALHNSYSLEQSALKWAAMTNPATDNLIQSQTDGTYNPNMVDKSQMGSILSQFLQQPGLREWAAKDHKNRETYLNASANAENNFPKLKETRIANAIGQRREDTGQNSAWYNAPGKESTDKIVADLRKDGILSASDEIYYQNNIRPKLGFLNGVGRDIGNVIPLVNTVVNDNPIPTTGALENVSGGIKESEHNLAKGVENLAGITPTLQQAIGDDYAHKGVNSKGFLSELAQSGGHMVGSLLPIIAGGELVGGSKLATGGVFALSSLPDNIKNSLKAFPDDPMKRIGYVTLMSGFYTAMGEIFPDGKAVPQGLRDDVTHIINQFSDGAITKEAAMDLAKKSFYKQIEQVPQYTQALIKHNLKGGALMTLPAIVDKTVKKAFGTTTESDELNAGDLVEQFGVGFLASSPLSAMSALGETKNINLAGKEIYKIAQNENYYTKLISEKNLPNKAELLDNLKDAKGIIKDLDTHTELTDGQKQKVLVHELAQKALERQIKEATSPAVKEKLKAQLELSKNESAKIFAIRDGQLEDKASDVSHENTPSGIKPTEEASDTPDKVQEDIHNNQPVIPSENVKDLNSGVEYRGKHQIINPITTADNLIGNGAAPEDLFLHMNDYHDLSDIATKESYRVLKTIQGNPDAEVTIYRSVPHGIDKINDGDWVTLSKTYAKEHGLHETDATKDLPVISTRVKAKDIGWDGNDLNEFVYKPNSEQAPERSLATKAAQSDAADQQKENTQPVTQTEVKDNTVQPKEITEAHTTAQEHGFKDATHAINAVNKDFGTDYKTVQEIPDEQLQASSDKRTMDEATQEAAKDLSDHTTNLINEEGITLDNLKDLKHLFNGFPYTAEDYASVENELRRQTESNGNAGQTGEAGAPEPTSDNAPTGLTENSQTTDSSQRETTQADTEKVNIPEDVTPDPNTAKQIADKLRQWAKLVEGDNTSFKSDLLAIPKSVISTLLKGAANIIEAGGTIKEAIDDFIENIKSYAKANQPDFDEKNLRNDVRDLFREIGIVTNDEELRAKTKEELTKYITKEGRKQLAELSRTASQNGTIKEAFSLSREIGHFLANSPIFKNKVFKGIVNAFHPFAFDTDGSARKAYMKIRNENSELNRQLEVLDNKLRAQMKAWNKVPKLDRQGFILSMENPEKYGSVAPEYEKYAKAYRALMDHAFDLISSVRDVNKIEDYFAHFWQDPKKADKVLKQINGNKPLEGSKSFLKQRFYNDYMDGIRNGLVPLTDNPGEIVQLAMRNAMRFKFAHDILGDLKGNGIVSYHKNPSSAPEGWRKINDNLFNPNRWDKISESGYYAPEPVANLINNFTSKGLFGGDGLVGTISNSIRWLNNLKNLFQLGFSPFHVATTTLETNVNGIAQAIKDFTTFKPERMGSALLQTVKTLSQVRTVQMVIKGNQIIRDYRNGNMTEDVQRMVAAGGRTGRQKIYSLDAWYNMNKAWNALTVDGGVNTTKENVSNGLKLLTNAVGVIPEVIMKPVMEHYVAALKIAGHSEALSKEIIRNPTMDGEKLLFKSQRLWDDMDDSLGNVVYDNYFWNKTVKDVGFGAIRSLGWTGGTIKKIGKAVGGAVDSFADIQNTDEGLKVNKGSLLKGEGLNIRSAWMVALPLTVGVFGGMLHKMLSGQNPKELEDYFFPWDGTYNPDGTKHRVSLPSYLKDIKGYATNFEKTVGNKLSPFFHEVYELLNNQDYYGTQIVNPNDPAYQKGVDILKYEAKSFTPFSFRKQPGQGVGINPDQERKQHAEQFFGLMPAAKEEGRSKLENAIVAEARKNYHNEAISKETRERIDNRIIVKDLLRSGKSYNEIPKEIRDKANYTPDGLRKVEKVVHLDPYMYKFKTLNAEQQLKLWGQMSKDEKLQYTKYLHKTETFSNLKAEKPEVFEINPEYVKYFDEMRKYKDLPKE